MRALFRAPTRCTTVEGCGGRGSGASVALSPLVRFLRFTIRAFFACLGSGWAMRRESVDLLAFFSRGSFLRCEIHRNFRPTSEAA